MQKLNKQSLPLCRLGKRNFLTWNKISLNIFLYIKYFYRKCLLPTYQKKTTTLIWKTFQIVNVFYFIKSSSNKTRMITSVFIFFSYVQIHKRLRVKIPFLGRLSQSSHKMRCVPVSFEMELLCILENGIVKFFHLLFC